jgi:Transcription factor WhiB
MAHTHPPTIRPAHPVIPFPHTSAVLACRTTPDLFTLTEGKPSNAQLQQTRTVCGACPIAPGCLLWALANPHLTHGQIWAATTPTRRAQLRTRLIRRLGENWPARIRPPRQARRTPAPATA